MTILNISQLVKRLGSEKESFLLKIPQFSLESGSQIALAGESGSGKTTLLHLICGIVAADEGSICIADTDITRLTESKRDSFRAQHIGVVYQTFNLLQGFTAKENVMLGGSFSRHPHHLASRAKELLERLGLEEHINRKPRELSVGQQQRVAVARALVHKPALVLADEPTANVDTANANAIITELRTLSAECGSTLVIISHDETIKKQMPQIVELSALRAN